MGLILESPDASQQSVGRDINAVGFDHHFKDLVRPRHSLDRWPTSIATPLGVDFGRERLRMLALISAISLYVIEMVFLDVQHHAGCAGCRL